jgi:hypothetical protein
MKEHPNLDAIIEAFNVAREDVRDAEARVREAASTLERQLENLELRRKALEDALRVSSER